MLDGNGGKAREVELGKNESARSLALLVFCPGMSAENHFCPSRRLDGRKIGPHHVRKKKMDRDKLLLLQGGNRWVLQILPDDSRHIIVECLRYC